MVSALDIYRATNVLVKQHGAEASINAAIKADSMLDGGGIDGRAAWLWITREIEKLQQRPPRPGQFRH